MWTLLWAVAATVGAPYFAAPPTYRVECSLVEVFPGGASTPLGSRVFYLQEEDEGVLRHGETLIARIKTVEATGKKVVLEMMLENSIEVVNKGDGLQRRTVRVDTRAVAEANQVIPLELPNANGEGGRYKFELRWRNAPPGRDKD